jgi:hypothetical protein
MGYARARITKRVEQRLDGRRVADAGKCFAQYMQVKLSRVYTFSRENRTPRLIVITFFLSRSTAGVLIVVEGDRSSSE